MPSSPTHHIAAEESVSETRPSEPRTNTLSSGGLYLTSLAIMIAWNKTLTARPNKGWFRTSQCEYLLVCRIPGSGVSYTNACLPGLFTHRRDLRAEHRYHLTDKPIPLMADILRVLAPGASVLDPFAGSASTLIAAMQVGHRCDAIELSRSQATLTTQRLPTHFKPVQTSS
jgi:site-specific DNA-methyltransferase (adenine-specific)